MVFCLHIIQHILLPALPFLKKFLLILDVHVWAECAHVCRSAWRSKETLDPLELELWTVMSLYVDAEN